MSEPKVVGTPEAEQARDTREATTGSRLTEDEQRIVNGEGSNPVNVSDAAIQGSDANARMKMAQDASAPEADTSGTDGVKVPYKTIQELTGYKREDVLSYNSTTKAFTTSNGGKYRISKNGKQVQHLAGPTPPSARG